MTSKRGAAAMPDITEAMVMALFKDLEVLNITRDKHETTQLYVHFSLPMPLRSN